MTAMTRVFVIGCASFLAFLSACTGPSPSPTLTTEQMDQVERLQQNSHDLVQWDQYPTIRNGRLTFSGSLAGEAVLYNETNEEAQSAIYSGNISFANIRTKRTGVVMRRPDGGDGFILN